MKVKWRDSYAGHGEMLFDYNHGRNYKENVYHNDYNNFEVNKANKKPKHKATFKPVRLQYPDHENTPHAIPPSNVVW